MIQLQFLLLPFPLELVIVASIHLGKHALLIQPDNFQEWKKCSLFCWIGWVSWCSWSPNSTCLHLDFYLSTDKYKRHSRVICYHPLRPSLLPHLLLQPHRHLPPPGCLPRCRGDQAHPGQDAHCLCSHCTRWNQSPILPNNGAEKVFRLLPSCWSANVSHPRLSTALNQRMQILGTLELLMELIKREQKKG